MNGRRQDFRIAGIVLSPDSSSNHDLARHCRTSHLAFLDALRRIQGVRSTARSMRSRSAPGASEREVIAAVDALLETCGGRGALVTETPSHIRVSE
jgi:hypothetical protein